MKKSLNIRGIRPFLHQKAVIDAFKDSKGTGKVICVKSSRQKGKSFLVSNLICYACLNNPEVKCFYIAPTLKQSKALYKTIVNGLGNSGAIKSRNATDLYIEFVNNSVIYMKSAEQRDGLRGYTADFLFIDEAAFIPEDVWHLIQPWTDFKKAPIVMTSTPWHKSGFFFRYYNWGLQKEHNTTTIDWSDEQFKKSIEEILPPERLEEYRQMLPQTVFQTEYLGEFLDSDSAVFPGLKKILKENKISPTDKLYVGIDWSNQGENDYTVVSAFNQKGEQVLLKYANNFSPMAQIRKLIQSELEPYASQIAVISCETNSIGEPYTDLIKEKSQLLKPKVQGFTTTNSSKNTIVMNMQVAIEQKEITLLPDKKQRAEFGYFSANYNPRTRNVSYAAPPGLHDDCVMATLIAYDALKNSTTRGHYNLVKTRPRYAR